MKRKPKRYYVDLEDNYEVGDTFIHHLDKETKYVILEIEDIVCLMLVEEIIEDE